MQAPIARTAVPPHRRRAHRAYRCSSAGWTSESPHPKKAKSAKEPYLRTHTIRAINQLIRAPRVERVADEALIPAGEVARWLGVPPTPSTSGVVKAGYHDVAGYPGEWLALAVVMRWRAGLIPRPLSTGVKFQEDPFTAWCDDEVRCRIEQAERFTRLTWLFQVQIPL